MGRNGHRLLLAIPAIPMAGAALLIGRVFEGNPGAIFEDMDPFIERISQMEVADRMDSPSMSNQASRL